MFGIIDFDLLLIYLLKLKKVYRLGEMKLNLL